MVDLTDYGALEQARIARGLPPLPPPRLDPPASLGFKNKLLTRRRDGGEQCMRQFLWLMAKNGTAVQIVRWNSDAWMATYIGPP